MNIENLPVFRDEKSAFGSPTSDSLRTMITEKTSRIFLIVINFGGHDNFENELKEILIKNGIISEDEEISEEKKECAQHKGYIKEVRHRACRSQRAPDEHKGYRKGEGTENYKGFATTPSRSRPVTPEANERICHGIHNAANGHSHAHERYGRYEHRKGRIPGGCIEVRNPLHRCVCDQAHSEGPHRIANFLKPRQLSH